MGLVGLPIGRQGRLRLPVSGGAIAAARTYADWVTQAAVLAPTARTWGLSVETTGETVRLTCAAATGAMSGTTFNTSQGISTQVTGTYARIVQHGLPDATIFGENVSSGRVVVITTEATGLQTATFAAINRNGYISVSDATDAVGIRITDIKYWDAALGKVRQWNPSVNGPITDYVW